MLEPKIATIDSAMMISGNAMNTSMIALEDQINNAAEVGAANAQHEADRRADERAAKPTNSAVRAP